MAHHVGFVEVHEVQAFDILEHIHGFKQSAAPRVGQIDLGDVAGDHRLGVESQTSDEHLHLLRGGVLGLVENYERVVESASTHKSDGSDLDDILLQIAVNPLGIEHVIQCVIERAQVWIDFLLQSPRQKAKSLAGFNGGAGKDDAVDAFG